MELQKDPEYSKRMLGEGNLLAVDEGNESFTMELPEWADEKKVAMGQRFFLLNINAMSRALLMGLMATASTPSILKILQFTKQSSTPATAYRRFKANALHAQVWNKYPIKPGTKAWTSLTTVRRIHVMVNRRSKKAGAGIISQTDMALTQFLFMGFAAVMPDLFGIVGTKEQFEAFSHLWRLIGYMLGTEDRFNCCGETIDETRRRLRSITHDMFRLALSTPNENYENYSKTVFDGLWHSDPTIHYDSTMFMMKRAVDVPGYYYFASEASTDIALNRKILKSLSYMTHFRILLDILIFEHLSKIFFFRWIFNISKFLVVLTGLYPFLPLISFGKRYAHVDIFKRNK